MSRRGWIDRLERRFGDFTIPNLAVFIVAMNAAVYLLAMFRPEFVDQLVLHPALVARGEVWRLFTFLFVPPRLGPIWMFFWLYLFYIYAQALENEWGEFRFNLYYAIGAVCTVLASWALGAGLPNIPLNTSLFLAFAALYPDFEILLFFVLPVKVKWLAWLAWAGLAGSLILGPWTSRLAVIAGLVNYAVFFGPAHWEDLQFKRKVRRNRKRFKDSFKDR